MKRKPTVVTLAHRAPMTEHSMPAVRKRRLTTHPLRLLITTLLLAMLGALLLAGTAPAAPKPGKPTAKAPKGTIATTKPAFTWSKAPRAARYEMRVYKGSKLLLKKTGLRKTTWKAVKALPANVAFTWKVRASNARGAGAWSRSLKFKIVPPSPAKAITAFSFQGLAPPVIGVINEAAHAIALTVPHGTNVSALVPTITITGASVSPASGAARDFTDPVIYTVTAADTSTQDYVVTVTVAAEWEKAITGFSFQGLAPPVIGVINEAAHTIALTVPFGTNLNGLVATFATTGASVKVGATPQVSGTTANSFTSPVTYTVTAADASTQTYTVTVTVAASPAKAITAFSFQGLAPPVIGVINEAAHTIGLTVPFGTPVTALVATFATNGASVKVGAAPQVSGTTANSFTSPVIYTVTAADASTQAYVVTVTVAAAVIGQSYGGGKIAYILKDGDPGYAAGQTRGLIAATADQTPAGSGIRWYNGTYVATGATAKALGAGLANTNRIIAVQGATATSYAAGLARACNDGGYADWYLPSTDELNKLYLNRVAIGGFASADYWSSSEYDANFAWYQIFVSGDQPNFLEKYLTVNRVRAVRAFPADSAKAITAFSFTSPVATGSISETAHTIALTVPFGTNVSALVPMIFTTGASVSPASGAAHDFSSPVTYTVTAADASTQKYTVTVTVAAPVIGQSYGGGKIAYVLQPGDPGYVAGQTHGLIAATADQTAPESSGIQWSTEPYWWKSAPGTSTALGSGSANTDAIIALNGAGTTYAAGLARAYNGGGYSDWYLPSKDELNKLYLNRVAIGGFETMTEPYYWSSSESQDDAKKAWAHDFGMAFQGNDHKDTTNSVRAVRAF